MIKIVVIAIAQSFLFTAGQVFLKLAILRMDKYSFTWTFIKALLLNWHLALSGVCFVTATIVWMYILKRYELSLVYPLASSSYVFGMLASIFIFNEVIPLTRWIGVGFIMIGVIFLVK